ncbi:hypothetical protein OG539_38780 [Actinacidiphila glaucinigra]|uniref:hypothetical protein n=1 Tax=Actinacidiphila glaucinigra TaxID=235986 RepID=UPI002DDAB93B|nr:hypothetical protein [Actinacidiphila glaucinigra]WSD58246.1 hypothetical protein OIE69_04715 [Actinacidiphila glaucinigra]
MARTHRTKRLVTLTAATALAAGGALIPTTAFAATTPSEAHASAAKTSGRGGGHGGGHGDWDQDWGGGRWNHDGNRPNSSGNGSIVIVLGNNNSTNINNGTVNNGVILD